MVKAWLVLVFAFSTAALAQTQSNTVPTNLLVSETGVAPSADGSSVVASVALAELSAVDGNESDIDLAQSSNDVFTFTGGGKTITYDPANAANDVLPLVVGGTYSFTFTRFNGETYTGSVILPATTAYSSPSPNQVFQKTDPVTVAWSNVTSDLTEVMAQSSCQDVLTAFTVNDAFTGAQIPAGAASTCGNGAVPFAIGVYNANMGTGFGMVAAATEADIQFSYGASSTLPRLSPREVIHRMIYLSKSSFHKTVFKKRMP